MSYRAYSNTLFGIKIPRKKAIQSSLQAQKEHELSYFYSDYEESTDVIVGFLLGKTDYNTYTEAVVCDAPTISMAQEIIEFCKDNSIDCDNEDLNMYTMTYHSY